MKPNTGTKSNQSSDTFRDSVGTIDSDGKRIWLFPTKPKGNLYKYRTYLSYAYVLVFFALPFVKIDGDPIFLFNIFERKFILFGITFWPQDFFVLGVGMLVFIVFIALFTLIYGRVFCGWICPQTIFMEMIFRKVEYLIEGDANSQRRLKKQVWDFNKIKLKTLKFLAFYVISFLIGIAFFSYLIGAEELISILKSPFHKNISSTIGIFIFTTIFFFVYWWFREQVCIIVCPYGRMQGVLLNKDSVVVAYDYVRGEPREKVKDAIETSGDCIDCNLCVKVCPTGIDIRNGTQLECVNCTACIDACDNIMESVNRPKGLIRYDSENNIKSKEKLRFTKKMKLYTAALVLLLVVEAILLVTRSNYDITVLRAKGLLYQLREDDKISNLYSIKFVNKTKTDVPIGIKIENMYGNIEMIGRKMDVKKESYAQTGFFIVLNKKDIRKRKTKVDLGFYYNGKKVKTVTTTFLGPITN
ncbi:MAG: cytochrome c oxidase accessory protein CcoG [Bacteroidetes bacterium]|nr:cytochrome c oxidase accessory protein CcoG [Bacteroidota bacterium]